MVKTPEDVFEIMKKECSFCDSIFTAQDKDECVLIPLEDCADLAGASWIWDDGVSKLVLIFRDLGFVIKIPYTGTSDREDCEEPCDNCSVWNECGGDRWDCARRRHWGYEDHYYDFTGAGGEEGEKNWKNIQNKWDYCEAEVWLYNKAVQEGVDICFAETRLLGYIAGHPIYTQTCANIFGNLSTTRKPYSKEAIASTKEACSRIDGWCFNVVWLTDFILYFDDDMFQKFMEFIKKYGILDLHNGNVGYIDDVPVLVDYSGYDS